MQYPLENEYDVDVLLNHLKSMPMHHGAGGGAGGSLTSARVTGLANDKRHYCQPLQKDAQIQVLLTFQVKPPNARIRKRGAVR